MKKTFLIIGLFLGAIFLFKGEIYRIFIGYKSVGERAGNEIQNSDLLQLLQANKHDSIEEIIDFARKTTNEHLAFSTGNCSRNANEVFEDGKANCIGYSALFNAIVSYQIKQQNLEKKYRTKHLVGKLEFLGFDLHKLFENSFFKEHDFNMIEHIPTGKRIYLDPSVSDYLRIDEVRSRD